MERPVHLIAGLEAEAVAQQVEARLFDRQVGDVAAVGCLSAVESPS